MTFPASRETLRDLDLFFEILRNRRVHGQGVLCLEWMVSSEQWNDVLFTSTRQYNRSQFVVQLPVWIHGELPMGKAADQLPVLRLGIGVASECCPIAEEG